MRTLLRSWPVRLLFIGAVLLVEGCSTLPLQKELAGLVTNALQSCQKEPARCAAALQCSHAATEAAEALQKVRGAELANEVDAAALEAGVKAQALPPAARAQCQALGFKYVPPPSERAPGAAAPTGGLADRIEAMTPPPARGAGVP